MNCKIYERLEFKFKEKISTALLNDEYGNQISIIPFIYQPIEFAYSEEGIERTIVSNEQYHTLRFTPKAEGSYRLDIHFENGDNITKELECKGYYNRGYVKISDKDKRYFSYTDDTPFFPIGINMAFPKKYPVTNNTEFGKTDGFCYIGMHEYEAWFEKCSYYGVNLVRIWVGHDYFNPDTEDAEVLNYSQFAKIDYLFALAKKYGLKLKITLDNFRKFKDDTDNSFPIFAKKLTHTGDECPNMKTWMTDEKWKVAWLNKVEEFAARYADDTELFAVELWNEMNSVGSLEYPVSDVLFSWNREMLEKVKSLFPRNLVTNSLGSLDNDGSKADYINFPWDKCDIMQIHRYLDQGASYEITRHNPIESLVDAVNTMKQNHMPLIIAETGAVDNCHCAEFKYYSSDDLGLIFVDCVYTPVFCGCASSGHIWHWDSRYVESKNLYKYFKPLADITKDINFTAECFESIDLSDDNVYLLLLKGKNTALGFIRNKNADWKNILRDLNKPHKTETNMSLAAKNVEVVPIWKNDTTSVKADKNKILFSDVLYGTLFKINY